MTASQFLTAATTGFLGGTISSGVMFTQLINRRRKQALIILQGRLEDALSNDGDIDAELRRFREDLH